MQLSAVLLTIGLPAIDESLDKLLVAMETFPNVAVLGDAVGLARIIGLLLALCVGSYECWMMMLGRRGMDVMKLLRIVGISICISSSSWICDALQVPGKGLESASKAMAQAKNKEVAAFELKVAQNKASTLTGCAPYRIPSRPRSRWPPSDRTPHGGTSSSTTWRTWATPSTTTPNGRWWPRRPRSANGSTMSYASWES